MFSSGVQVNSLDIHAIETALSSPQSEITRDQLSDFGEWPDEIPAAGYIEGAVKTVTVNRYERDPRARKECLKEFGYSCAVCGFNFEAAYGEMGKNYIHVHHLLDLAEIGKEYTIQPLKDLRPVCPNCHAMLHTERPALSIAALKKRLGR